MNLPLPSADALAHSQALCDHIRAAIHAGQGWISFAQFMDAALYTPGLGYYSGGAQKFGASGDFVTAPEISPLFGRTLARQVAQIMAVSAPVILEPGAGTGRLAADLLMALAEMDCVPTHYYILELSGELRERQRATLAQRVPQWLERVVWLTALPEQFRGVVVANEVLDAMPVHLVHWTEVGIQERGVALAADGAFTWQDRPAVGPLLAAAKKHNPAAPYLSEMGLAAQAWIESWARSLEQGALLLLDYGFPEREFFHPQRQQGTLMCHYRHHAHGEPFHLPGLTDITAHVDFTAMVESGFNAGLDLLGYTSQGQFLLNCGLTEQLAGQVPAGGTESAEYLKLASGVQKLISPSEMGELFKVVVLGRGIETPLLGFERGDRCHTL